MTEEIKIQSFDGKNYNIWKKRIFIYLQWKKCDEVVTRARLPTDDETTWNEKNLRVMNYIYNNINDDQLMLVNEEKTAYDIIKKLDTIYTKKSFGIQMRVHNKLRKMRLMDYEESSMFFMEFDKLIKELKNAGATITEREKLNYMLQMLPNSLDHMYDLIDIAKESDKTCEFLKNKIVIWEAREESKNCQNQSREGAFESEPQKICFGCGKPGHIKANCRHTWSGEGSRRNSASGGAYERGAHQSYQRRGSSARGRGMYQRGRGWQQLSEWDRY